VIIEEIEFDNAVERLLEVADLQVSDLRDSNRTQLFCLRDDASLIGVVGIEAYETDGLLRSLVINENHRKSGYGKMLVEKAEAWAFEKGIKSLYLLTTTADRFFSGLGYMVAPRTLAPVSIAKTEQFAGLCPASAVFMHKDLR
jgi:N-acetylglutamate synthase-like GNAT family acetyltransferase